MKYALLLFTMLGATTITSPALAQFSSFPSGSDSCSNLCFKVDLGSANNDNSFGSGFGSGFGTSTSSGASSLKWQVGVTWRPNPPEGLQVDAEKVKQKLEDNRSLMVALAEAISQNRTEMARGIAILLAPRLGYTDPRKLLTEMKEGSTNLGSARIEPPKVIPPLNSAPVELPKAIPNSPNPAPVEPPKAFPTLINPAPFGTPKGTTNISPPPSELR
jgi:hypothetical protein